MKEQREVCLAIEIVGSENPSFLFLSRPFLRSMKNTRLNLTADFYSTDLEENERFSEPAASLNDT